MKTRLVRMGLLICGALLGIAGYDAWATAQDEPATADQPADDSKQDDLHVRFARAHVQLIQLEIQKAQEANARVPSTIPPFMLEQMQGQLAYAQGRLNQALGKSEEGTNPYYQLADFKLRVAQDNLRKAEIANRMNPNTVSPVEVARRKAAVEVEQLRLEMAKNLDLASPTARMEWELDELHDEVAYLRIQTSKLLDRN